jgi:hypothetical protein
VCIFLRKRSVVTVKQAEEANVTDHVHADSDERVFALRVRIPAKNNGPSRDI